MKKLEWKTEKRKLSELIPYEKNPRILTEKIKKDLVNSLTKFGLAEIPVINTDNTLIAGHQRCKILLELEGPDFEIEVRIPNRKLNEKEFEEYLLRSNRNSAEWDWNMLDTDFSTELLLDSGFEDFEINIDKTNINNMFGDLDSKKKKVKVKNCEVCKNGVSLEVKYFIKNNTFDNYSFKDNNDKSKLIYERLKDLLDGNDLHIIIVEKEIKENDEIISS